MTDWICICAEGETGDRRYIERDWLMDAAELYDPALKTAMIWPYHERDPEKGNYGEVLALQCEESEDGIMRLYARLRPNIMVKCWPCNVKRVRTVLCGSMPVCVPILW